MGKDLIKSLPTTKPPPKLRPYVVQSIEVGQQFVLITALPVVFIAHQQNVWLQFANARCLHERPGGCFEIITIDQRVEAFDLMFLQPIAGLTLQEYSLPL